MRFWYAMFPEWILSLLSFFCFFCFWFLLTCHYVDYLLHFVLVLVHLYNAILPWQFSINKFWAFLASYMLVLRTWASWQRQMHICLLFWKNIEKTLFHSSFEAIRFYLYPLVCHSAKFESWIQYHRIITSMPKYLTLVVKAF